MVGTLGTIAGGSGYVNGTYGGVALTGGTGSGATANITISGGAVTAVTILAPGVTYTVGDVLSASAASIGGAGSGFSVPILSTSINSSLAGGTVGYYVPNTLTFKSTWRNAAQTLVNSNPVLLDQNGCAVIYGLGSYRQIVKDSLGNTVWDAVTASTATSVPTPATSGVGDFMAIGTVIPLAAFSAPTNYVLAYGQALNRTTYSDALTAITISSSATCSSGSASITGIADTSQMRVGAPIESACLPSSTTVATIAGASSITTSANATASGTNTIRVFPWGNGNGSTTFNVPDLRGRILPGPDAMGGVAASRLISTYYGAVASPPGVAGGSQSKTLITGNLPAYTPAGTIVVTDGSTWLSNNQLIWNNGLGPFAATAAGAAWGVAQQPVTRTGAATAAFTGTAQGGTSAAFATIQPSLTINYAIKVLNGTLPIIGVLSLGGMTGDIECGTGLSCAANTIGLSTSLGSMAFQDANNVAITGGAITGMANPVNPLDVANKQYVDAATQGLIVLPESNYATAAILPNTPTYANGALGVGATLTAGANAALVVDGSNPIVGNVILVKNQASLFQNGIYTVTAAGSGGAPWVLTRATYFDQAAEMLAGSYTRIIGGVVNFNKSWAMQPPSVTTVGTNPVIFNLFVSFDSGNCNLYTPVSGDNTTAFNTAIAANAAAGRKTCFLQSFDIDGSIQIPHNTWIEGVDKFTTCITKTAGSAAVTMLANNASGSLGNPTRNVTFKNFCIDGAASTLAGQAYPIGFTYVSYLTLDNINIFNCYGTCILIIGNAAAPTLPDGQQDNDHVTVLDSIFNGSGQILTNVDMADFLFINVFNFERNVVTGCGANCLGLEFNKHFNIARNSFTNFWRAVYVETSQYGSIDNNDIYNSGTISAVLSDATMYGIWIVDANQTYVGAGYAGGRHIRITNNRLHNLARNAGTTGIKGIAVDAPLNLMAQDIYIAGNTMDQSGTNGALLGGTTNFIALGGDIQNVVATGNTAMNLAAPQTGYVPSTSYTAPGFGAFQRSDNVVFDPSNVGTQTLPTVTVCTGLGAGGCALTGGNMSGNVLLSAGAGAAATGAIRIAFNANIGQLDVSCNFSFANGSGGWTTPTQLTQVSSTALVQMAWANGGVALTNGSAYNIKYTCQPIMN